MRIKSIVRAQQPLCPDCLAVGVVRVWEELDHVVALEHGGTNDLSNLVGLCKPHHVAKTAKDRGYKQSACDAQGNPVDPGHHWYGEGRV